MVNDPVRVRSACGSTTTGFDPRLLPKSHSYNHDLLTQSSKKECKNKRRKESEHTQNEHNDKENGHKSAHSPARLILIHQDEIDHSGSSGLKSVRGGGGWVCLLIESRQDRSCLALCEGNELRAG